MEKQDEFYLSEDAQEWIGLKKSEYLSKLIENQPAGDYGFEDFHRYDHLIASTIETPDEVWEKHESFPIQVFVRTYETDLHHILIGGIFPEEQKKNLVYVPILSFVTKGQELAMLFCEGEKKRRPVLN